MSSETHRYSRMHEPAGQRHRPRQLYTTVSGHLYHAGQVCIVMVGLPGRGKTNLSERISRFLNWLGVPTKTFHLSNYRRQMLGEHFQLSKEYFLNESPGGDRANVVNKCLGDVKDYFKKEKGQVVIYDAVNATSQERLHLLNMMKENGVECLFVESLVTDERVLARNIAEVRMTSPDYAGKDPRQSVEHYLRHIETRIMQYEPVWEPELCCIKLVNDGEHCIVQNGPLGYLLNRVLMFLLNSRRRTGSLFFARAGATDANQYTNNGDNDLNPRGRMYAATLANTLMGYISSKQLDWNDIKMDLAQLKRVADQKSQFFASALPSAIPSAATTQPNSRDQSRRNSLFGAQSPYPLNAGSPRDSATVSATASTVNLHHTNSAANLERTNSAANLQRTNSTASTHNMHHNSHHSPNIGPVGTPPKASGPFSPTSEGGNNSSANVSRIPSVRGSAARTPTDAPLVVWTSVRRTALQTARPFREAGIPVDPKSLLTQLNPGDAAPYYSNPEELQEHFPAEYKDFLEDTYHYRFPRAESYQDVAVRLEPLIMNMEREQTNLLIVGHETVLRVLYGYVMGLNSEDIPHLHFPADQIVELVPHGYSNLVVNIPLSGVSLDGGVNLPEGVTVTAAQDP